MALVKCPNCGSMISDSAKHCPKCGIQLMGRASREKNKTALYALLSVLGALILIIGGTIVYSDYSEKKAQEEARLEAERAEQARVRQKAEQDAADWVRATSEDSEQAYQDYLMKHEDGEHAAEAQEQLDKIERKKLSNAEAYDVSNTIEGFFNSLSAGNEEDMLKCISPVMDNFLGKAGATKVDAISFMRRLHADDVYSVNISLDNNDIHVSKTLQEGASPVYQAEFSYDQRLEREDTSLETFASIKGSATLNENFKITSMSLKKMSSY